MQSQLPLNDVLSAVVDRAVELTSADRGIMYQVSARGDLDPVLARQHGAHHLDTAGFQFSPQVRRTLTRALEEHKSITETVTLPERTARTGQDMGKATGVSWMVIPLLQPFLPVPEGPRAPNDILGLLYLDSYSPLTFGCNDGRVLRSLAVQAASVMANARLAQKEFERQQLVQELGIARRIQQALLPKEFREYTHLQVTGISNSCSAVGGDYFDCSEFGGGQTAFIVADVSGHGLGAALLSTMLQGTFTTMSLGLKPDSIFRNANRFICGHPEVGRHATMFIGLLAMDGKLEYVNAGHWPPLLMRQNQLTPVSPATSIPVGLIDRAEFAPKSGTLLPGDTLILYSDGIIEATNEQNIEFGMAGLQNAISTCAGTSVKELHDSILTALARFTCGASQADDSTIFILRYTG
jgi:phosphoserine phosphatase RsbU/P